MEPHAETAVAQKKEEKTLAHSKAKEEAQADLAFARQAKQKAKELLAEVSEDRALVNKAKEEAIQERALAQKAKERADAELAVAQKTREKLDAELALVNINKEETIKELAIAKQAREKAIEDQTFAEKAKEDAEALLEKATEDAKALAEKAGAEEPLGVVGLNLSQLLVALTAAALVIAYINLDELKDWAQKHGKTTFPILTILAFVTLKVTSKIISYDELRTFVGAFIRAQIIKGD